MLELLLLTRLGDEIDKWSEQEYSYFNNIYDINKMSERSRELQNKFLTPYVIDNSVTALINDSQL